MAAGGLQFGAASQKVFPFVLGFLGCQIACFSSPLLSGTRGLGKMFEPMEGGVEGDRHIWLVCIEAAMGTFFKASSKHLKERKLHFQLRGTNAVMLRLEHSFSSSALLTSRAW